MIKTLSEIKKQIHEQTERINELSRMVNEYEQTITQSSDNSEIFMRVVNISGIPIIKGQLCYLCGVSDGTPTVTTVKHHSMKIAGNATDHIRCSPFDNKGYLMVKGTLRGCDSVEVDYSQDNIVSVL